MHDIGSRPSAPVELLREDFESFANCLEAINTPLSTRAVQIIIPASTVESYLPPFLFLITDPQRWIFLGTSFGCRSRECFYYETLNVRPLSTNTFWKLDSPDSIRPYERIRAALSWSHISRVFPRSYTPVLHSHTASMALGGVLHNHR